EHGDALIRPAWTSFSYAAFVTRFSVRTSARACCPRCPRNPPATPLDPPAWRSCAVPCETRRRVTSASGASAGCRRPRSREPSRGDRTRAPPWRASGGRRRNRRRRGWAGPRRGRAGPECPDRRGRRVPRFAPASRSGGYAKGRSQSSSHAPFPCALRVYIYADRSVQGVPVKTRFTSLVRVPIGRVVVACVALALTGASVPSGRPEDVGLSTERLQRINQVVQRYIDTKQIAGAVTVVSRRG